MKIEFPVPQGFTPPEGVKEGEDFEFMASGHLAGGNLVLTAIEGQLVGEKKKPKPTENEAQPQDDRGFVDSVETGLS